MLFPVYYLAKFCQFSYLHVPLFVGHSSVTFACALHACLDLMFSVSLFHGKIKNIFAEQLHKIMHNM